MDYSKDQCSAIIKYCKKYKSKTRKSKSIKSKSKSKSIKSKSIKSKIIKSKSNVCEKWLNNKNINPATNRKIKTNGSIYKKLQKDCSPKSKRSPLKIRSVSVKLDDDVLQFGKYKGYKIINVINKNPNYASWLYKQQWLKKKYSNIYRILEQNIHKFTRFNRSK